MELNNNGFNDEATTHQEQEENKPNAYRVDDDDNLEEKDLERNYLFTHGEEKNVNEPGMEGKGMGGQSFGQDNITPAGNDKDNPSQLVGNNNEYFNRTQPAEEHPENSNFTDPNQAGNSNYSAAMDVSQNGRSDENSGQTQESQQSGQPHPQQPYQEGTADDDGDSKNKQTNIPGPNEVPDQQKVGE